ncbi:tRNA (adenosine(37)-N6)-threonylcarbamoyltransferase complex transferase subunit TsaD [Leptolinea tardivitalis]|uniref:tRNA N6-adenosine threonylcarbamoyltransferase n=1 Tax=Leptolinea tardivitalis TaxID=229920 RepID=A0A0P6X0B1_9CHLR|nr:tRNA (adenosine(37)-N6)-threonylcarbamoyltransferase complex transferase subunit TsaD [Leptolinea tardivitalis]KPL72583.1 tRNA threonylcarbamoyladenosine biosynthesis protein Gcp [Leptolinea tardivitalis]GAP21112.1 O-sialoglycoprotein endopeptidase [Leptolinea tardivitalis]
MTEIKTARILGIESSCDETAAAVIENGNNLLASSVATQIELHKKFGGVFPEVASRQHTLSIYPIIEETLLKAHLSWDDIDAIAATRGPGLAGSLVVGFNAAKGIALARNLPLIGVNHLEGHIYSAWVKPEISDRFTPPEFPVMALLVSGGHTELNLMEGHLNYRRLGATLDDAAGEAFDKVARLLGLPYPGGPSIQKAAETGNPTAFNFPRARLEGGWDFSFSGLKTAVLRTIKHMEEDGKDIPVADMAASFQEAVVDVLLTKTMAAAREYKVKEIVVAGGVSANKALRSAFTGQGEFPVHIPPLYLCTDNAAMIASAGYYRFVHGHIDSLDMDVLPNWPLS